MAGRPLVLAHRGASAVAPENTIAAFSKARELGADGVELDVRRSADGVLIVHHDADDRGCRAAGATHVRRAPRRAADGPDLRRGVRRMPGHDRERRGEVPALGDRRRPRRFGDARRRSMRWPRRDGSFIVSSFALAAVDLARALRARRRDGVADPRTGARRRGADRGRSRASMAQPRRRPPRSTAGAGGDRRAHAAGVLVSAWTVDDPKAARALAAAGVDIIISNVPDVIIAGVDCRSGSRS